MSRKTEQACTELLKLPEDEQEIAADAILDYAAGGRGVSLNRRSGRRGEPASLRTCSEDPDGIPCAVAPARCMKIIIRESAFADLERILWLDRSR
jgi:hypothetical protein